MCSTVTFLPSDIPSFLTFLNIDPALQKKLKLFAERIENSGYYLQYQKASQNDGWGCIPMDDYSIIQYHPTNHNVNYVAHEFFHALHFKNGFLKPNDLLRDILMKSKFVKHIPPKFPVDFINNLQHNKFYSEYINDGYAARDFVENNNKKQVKWLTFLYSLLKMRRSELGVFHFIKPYVELKCYWNPRFKNDYKIKMTILQQRNRRLFRLLETLFDDIKMSDCKESRVIIETFFKETEQLIT